MAGKCPGERYRTAFLFAFQKDDIARAKKTDEVSPDDDVIDEDAGGDAAKKTKSSDGAKKKASKSALEADEVSGGSRSRLLNGNPQGPSICTSCSIDFKAGRKQSWTASWFFVLTGERGRFRSRGRGRGRGGSPQRTKSQVSVS